MRLTSGRRAAHVRGRPAVLLPHAVRLRVGHVVPAPAAGRAGRGRLLVRVPDHRPGRVHDAHEQCAVPARDRPGAHRVPAAHGAVARAPAPRRPHVHHRQQRAVPEVRAHVQPVRDPQPVGVLGRRVRVLRVPVRDQGGRVRARHRVQPAARGRLRRGRAGARRGRRQGGRRRRRDPAARLSRRDPPLDTVQPRVQRQPESRERRPRQRSLIVPFASSVYTITPSSRCSVRGCSDRPVPTGSSPGRLLVKCTTVCPSLFYSFHVRPRLRKYIQGALLRDISPVSLEKVKFCFFLRKSLGKGNFDDNSLVNKSVSVLLKKLKI